MGKRGEWLAGCRHAPLPNSSSQLANQIPVGPHVLRVPVPGHRTWPVCEAFVMLCGQNHIPGNRCENQVRTKEAGSGHNLDLAWHNRKISITGNVQGLGDAFRVTMSPRRYDSRM